MTAPEVGVEWGAGRDVDEILDRALADERIRPVLAERSISASHVREQVRRKLEENSRLVLVADELSRLDEVAYERKRAELIDDVVLPELRATINRLLNPGFDPALRPLDSSGLRDLYDPKYEVSVRATTRLTDLLRGLKAGSIGIAGPRGVGKTTLIHAACQGRLGPSGPVPGGTDATPRGVSVSAPVRFDSRDFVRNLFIRLCRAELAAIGVGQDAGGLSQGRVEALTLVGGLAGFATLLIGLCASGIQYAYATRALMLGVAVLCLLAAGIFVLLKLGRSVRAWRRSSEETPIIQQARENLEQLRYLETISKERSGEVAAKGLKLGAKLGMSRTPHPWTLLETVERYRRFLDLLAKRGPVVIGLDELDKMASADEARSFLNEMKSLFDQPGVYYLVSISEDALSDFERRGQPIRDVFDSVFSEVLHIDYLSRQESDELLRRRAIGVAPPWPALFHCLSGGLPRESIRVARQAIGVAGGLGPEEPPDLTKVTAELTAERTRAHEHAAAVIAQGHVRRDGTQPLLEWLRGLPPISMPDTEGDGASTLETARSGFLRRIESIAEVYALESEALPDGSGDSLARLTMELAAGWHHSLTCLEFFADLDAERFAEACRPDATGRSPVDLLARGHQDLTASPSLSWRTVTEFRGRVGLGALTYPLAGPATAIPS